MDLTILHFNDVYHISDPDLVAKFATVLSDPSYVTDHDHDQDTREGKAIAHSIRVFSGDAFSPSLEAAVLRGDHMAPLLGGLDIDVACYGNHDFDFGEERLVEIVQQTSFPWTLANAVKTVRDSPSIRQASLLAGAREYVTKQVSGFKLGFFGLAGTDWPSNCQHLPECNILDPAVVAKRVASRLRMVEKCDLVIAVTHMRLCEDLATMRHTLSGPGRVDLILGGHDHHVVRRYASDTNTDPEVLQPGCNGERAAVTDCRGDVRIIKSGTDWKGLSILQLKLTKDSSGQCLIADMFLRQIEDLKALPVYNQIPPSREILDILRTTHDKIEQVVTQPLFHTTTPLDGRTHIIRSQETNLGNLLADAVRAFYDVDVALVNSGAIRCDRIVESVDNCTPLSIRDAIEISPFGNAFVVKRVGGNVLAEALENSVSDAHTDGRFLQLSGLSMSINWRCPEGHRISDIRFHTRTGSVEALKLDRAYTVAMVDFIGSGFDGYTCFQDSETLIDTEGAINDTNLLLEIFKSTEGGEKEGHVIEDQHTDGIRRARDAIFIGYHHKDSLPIVGPVLEGRIEMVP